MVDNLFYLFDQVKANYFSYYEIKPYTVQKIDISVNTILSLIRNDNT